MQGVAILQHVALLRTRAVAVVPRPANSQCPRVFSRRSYIATQGPTETTVNDFWQMVCEKGSNVIVMLTALHDAGKEQCTQYFPAPSATAQYGDIKVTTAKEDKPNSSIVVRTFSLEVVAKPTRMNEDMAGKRFEIKHYQYLDFSPIKTPENPAGLLEFISTVKPEMAPNKPVVVHCDHGTGRTGVYIVLDSEIDRLVSTGATELFDATVNARRCRAKMVETKAQFVFLHRALLYRLLGGPNHVVKAAGLTEDQSKFVAHLSVPGNMASFDLGHAGRKILSFESIEMVQGAEKAVPCTLAITSDVVLVCRTNAKSEGTTLVAYGQRDQLNLKPSLSKRDPLMFQIRLQQGPVVLKAADLASKTQWIERLNNIEDSFTQTGSLSGERMITARPSSRRAALQLLHCADPGTKDGSDALKAECGTIPLVFNSGGQADNVSNYLTYRAPLPQQPVPQYRTEVQIGGMVFSPHGTTAVPAAHGSDAAAIQTVPEPEPLTEQEQLIQDQMKEINLLRKQLSNTSLFAQQAGVSPLAQAPPVTEAVLAAKLRELEAAIDNAQKLEHVAMGGTGNFNLSQPFLLSDEKKPKAAPPPPLNLDDPAPPAAPMETKEQQITRRYSQYSNISGSKYGGGPVVQDYSHNGYLNVNTASPVPPTSPGRFVLSSATENTSRFDTVPRMKVHSMQVPPSPSLATTVVDDASQPISPAKKQANARASWKGVRSKAATLLAMGIRPKLDQKEATSNPFAITKNANRRMSEGANRRTSTSSSSAPSDSASANVPAAIAES